VIITILGTHGAGKSTLTYLLASHYKKIGKNVKIIQEVARDCPFPINERMTSKTCFWIYYQQCLKEMEAREKYDIIICDRSCVDSFFYAEYFCLFDRNLNNLKTVAKSQLAHSYDKVIFIRPDIPIIGDGVRSVDQEFQMAIDEIFELNLRPVTHTEIKSSDIFKGESWKHFCL